MKKYRAMLPDWFLDVLAEDEADAQNKARQALLEMVSASDFIVWEDDRPTPPPLPGQS